MLITNSLKRITVFHFTLGYELKIHLSLKLNSGLVQNAYGALCLWSQFEGWLAANVTSITEIGCGV